MYTSPINRIKAIQPQMHSSYQEPKKSDDSACKEKSPVPTKSMDTISLTSNGTTLLSEKNEGSASLLPTTEDGSERNKALLPTEELSPQEIKQMAKDMDARVKMQKDAFDNYAVCLKISSRIINGDNVPMKDQQFLAQNQSELYMKAIMLRRQKEDPEDYDSLLDDDEEDGSDTDALLRAAGVETASSDTEPTPDTETEEPSP